MLLLILNLIQCRLKRYIKFNSDQIELRIGLNHLIKFNYRIILLQCDIILYVSFNTTILNSRKNQETTYKKTISQIKNHSCILIASFIRTNVFFLCMSLPHIHSHLFFVPILSFFPKTQKDNFGNNVNFLTSYNTS